MRLTSSGEPGDDDSLFVTLFVSSTDLLAKVLGLSRWWISSFPITLVSTNVRESALAVKEESLFVFDGLPLPCDCFTSFLARLKCSQFPFLAFLLISLCFLWYSDM